MNIILRLSIFFAISTTLFTQSFDAIVSSYQSGQPKVVRSYAMINSNLQPKKETGFYEDGSKQYEGTYKNGSKDGQWTYYDRDGKRAIVYRYRNNEQVDERVYAEIDIPASAVSDGSKQRVFEKKFNQEISDLNNKVSRLSSNVNDIDNIKSSMSTIAMDLKILKQKIATLDGIADSVNAIINDLTGELLETVSISLDAHNNVIATQIESSGAIIKSEILKNKQEIDRLLGMTDVGSKDMGNTISRLESEINKIQQTVSEKLLAKDARIDGLYEEIVVNRKKIDSLSANIESNVGREVVEKVSPPVENENTVCDIKFTAYDRAPVNVKPVSPEYPEESRLNGVEGKVYVRAIIDINGDVACAEVIKGLSDDKVNESARDAVLNSTWQPATAKGQKVEVALTLPIIFKLN